MNAIHWHGAHNDRVYGRHRCSNMEESEQHLPPTGWNSEECHRKQLSTMSSHLLNGLYVDHDSVEAYVYSTSEHNNGALPPETDIVGVHWI